MRSICLQIVGVYVVATIFCWAIIVADTNSILNLIFLMALPLGTSVWANWTEGVARATGMALTLLLCSFFGLVTAIIYTGA